MPNKEWEKKIDYFFVSRFPKSPSGDLRDLKELITTLLHSEREKGRVGICGDRHQEVADKARAEERERIVKQCCDSCKEKLNAIV